MSTGTQRSQAAANDDPTGCGCGEVLQGDGGGVSTADEPSAAGVHALPAGGNYRRAGHDGLRAAARGIGSDVREAAGLGKHAEDGSKVGGETGAVSGGEVRGGIRLFD